MVYRIIAGVMKAKLISGFLVLGVGAAAQATLLVANFDGQAEGVNGFSLTDNGITFSNATWNIGGTTGFVIDQATSALFGPTFTAPNVMNFGGYAPGPGSGGGRIGRFQFTAGSAASTAELDVYSFGDITPGNVITLNGYLGATIVSSANAVLVNSGAVASHYHLSLSVGNYDHFALAGSGALQGGDNFLAVDNVAINTVPEPLSLLGLGLGLTTLISRRPRRKVLKV